jgi:hypothetical protein
MLLMRISNNIYNCNIVINKHYKSILITLLSTHLSGVHNDSLMSGIGEQVLQAPT